MCVLIVLYMCPQVSSRKARLDRWGIPIGAGEGVTTSRSEHVAGAASTAQFTCFTSAKVQILTSCNAQQLLGSISSIIASAASLALKRARLSAAISASLLQRYFLYLLYWYKSTNTDSLLAKAHDEREHKGKAILLQFTCVTSTKVIALTDCCTCCKDKR